MPFARFLLSYVMKQFAILRVGKIKGMGSVRAAGGHNLRTRPTPNADPNAPPPRVLHGPSDLGDAVAHRLQEAGVKKPRKDAVLCSELVLTGSPDRMAAMTPAELEAWAADNVAWLRENHGANLVQVVMHLDEQTPHLHACVVPVNEGGGLSAKRYWGEASGLTRLQTAYGERMAPHGLERGIEGSRARHATLRAFYGAVEAAHEPTPPPPMPDRPRAEESALFGLVPASTVANAERLFRRLFTRWGKTVLESEERARLAAAGLASENRALKQERAETAKVLTKTRTVWKVWKLIAQHCPDELKALVEKAKEREQQRRMEENRLRLAALEKDREAKEATARLAVSVVARRDPVTGPKPNPQARGPVPSPTSPPVLRPGRTFGR